MSYYEIPLSNDPDQNFQCTIPVDYKNLTLYFRIRYNTEAEYWVMSLYDSNGNILIDTIPLLQGNVLSQYKYLGIGSAYIVNASNVPTDRPDDTNLGTEFKLIWGDTVG